MKTLPADVRPYKRTATFTEATVPAAITGAHTTKPGVWGEITVERGELVYEIIATGESVTLAPGRTGIVEPTVPHRVRITGPVAFHVTFHR